MMLRAFLPLVGLLAYTPEVTAIDEMCTGNRATRERCANEIREEMTTPVSRRQVPHVVHIFDTTLGGSKWGLASNFL